MMTRTDVDSGAIKAWIGSVRPVNWRLVLLGVIVYMVLAYVINIWVTPSKLMPSVPPSTGYFVSNTFLNALPFIVIMASLLLVVGVRGHDLGFKCARLLPAIAWVGGTWIAAQLTFLVMHAGDVSLGPVWVEPHIRQVQLGSFVTGQLLGNALLEEVFWRAFVLTQLVLLLERRVGLRFWSAMAWAIVLTAVLFSLSHLPHDIANELSMQQILGMQAVRIAGGLVFAGVFVLSGNIFVAIGLHALVDIPLPLFGPPDSMSGFMVMVPFVLLAILAILRRFRRPRTAS